VASAAGRPGCHFRVRFQRFQRVAAPFPSRSRRKADRAEGVVAAKLNDAQTVEYARAHGSPSSGPGSPLLARAHASGGILNDYKMIRDPLAPTALIAEYFDKYIRYFFSTNSNL
jgi:hypothetical protein